MAKFAVVNELLPRFSDACGAFVKLMDNSTIPEFQNRALVGALYNLGYELADSAVFLIAHDYYSTAATLIRPTFEALARGHYFQYYATELQAAKFKEDSLELPISKIMKRIEKDHSGDLPPWTKLLAELWDDLSAAAHSHTHAGVRGAVMRVTEHNQIGCGFEAEDAEALLATYELLMNIAILSSIQTTQLLRRDDAKPVLDTLNKLPLEVPAGLGLTGRQGNP